MYSVPSLFRVCFFTLVSVTFSLLRILGSVILLYILGEKKKKKGMATQRLVGTYRVKKSRQNTKYVPGIIERGIANQNSSALAGPARTRIPVTRHLGLVYTKYEVHFISFLFFFPSHLLSSPFYSLSLLIVTQIRGHIRSRLFSPATHYGSCLAFLSREDLSSFFPRRLASNCAYPS